MEPTLEQLREARRNAYYEYLKAEASAPLSCEPTPLCLYDVKVEKAKMVYEKAKTIYEEAIIRQAREELRKERNDV